MSRMLSQHLKPNTGRWVTVIFLLVLSIFVQFYLSRFSLLIRLCSAIMMITAIVFFFWRTMEVKRIQEYSQGVIQEVKRVIWPTRREVMQTTGAVFLMAFIMGIVLWLVDSLLIRIVARLSGHVGG